MGIDLIYRSHSGGKFPPARLFINTPRPPLRGIPPQRPNAMNDKELEQFIKLRGTPPSDIKLKKKIDAGGVSDIWLATHPSQSQPFIVKYAKSMTQDNLYLQGQFEREFEASQVLIKRHAESCTTIVVDCDTDVFNHPYLFVEYFKAKPLDLLMPQFLDWPSMKFLLEKIIHIIHQIHAAGIIHRDIKPANIIINTQNEVRIIDFALAAIDGNWHPYHTEGLAIGTPLYMSPEQAYGKKSLLTPASDWYALGVTLYEWISGVVPFHGKTPVETIRMHCFNEVPAIMNNRIKNAPPELNQIVLQLLSKKASQRLDAIEQLKFIVFDCS